MEMETSQQEKTRLKEIAIKNAISSWNNKKNGIYRSFEKERYTPEYCEEQIEYFKSLKL